MFHNILTFGDNVFQKCQQTDSFVNLITINTNANKTGNMSTVHCRSSSIIIK